MTITFAITSIDYQGNAVFQNGPGNADPLNVWLERGGVLVQGSWGEADANAQGWTYVGAQIGDVPFAQRLNAASPVSGPAVPAPPPPPVVSALKVATVNGSSQLQHADGTRWVADGVTEWSIADNVSDDEGNATSLWTNLSTAITQQESYGINAVRLRLLAGYYNSLDAADQAAYVAQVVQRLAQAKVQGAILFPILWDGTDAGPEGFDYSGVNLATQYAQLYPLIEAVCAATSNDPDLVWMPVNEPNAITFAQWLPMVQGIDNCLRAAGYTGPIFFDPPNWANSGNQGAGFSDGYYTQLEQYDAGLLDGPHQIVFSCHQYWSPSWAGVTPQGSTGGWSSTTFQNTVLGGTATHCIVVTEIGFDNLAPGNTSTAWSTAAMTALRALPATMPNFGGVMGFNWMWIDDNTLVETSDGQTLTAWGDIYFNVTPPTPLPVSAVSSPTVSGTYQVGDTLTATPGVYDNAVSVVSRWANSPSTAQGVESFQTTIPGTANEQTYTLQSSDVGLLVTYEETATGAAGDTVVRHGWGTTVVVAAPPSTTPPANTALPAISGTAAVGDTLTASAGTWSGNPAPTYTYQWQRGTTNVSNATSIGYPVTAADEGSTLRVVVTATNSAGNASATSAATSVVGTPVGTTSEDFAGWWCWGQNQGGPGGGTLMGPCTPPNTAWSDNFTTPVPAGTQNIPAKDDLWGTLQTASAAYYGLPALPSGVTGNAAMFEVTPAQVTNYALTGYGAVMAKLFSAFGTTLTSSPWYTKPSNVSGTYGAWFYFPTGFQVPANKTDWINLFQFKQTTTTGQNDPMWWVNVSSYYWAQQTQSNTPWATSARPTKTTDPVMYLNCEGGPIIPMLYAVPTGQWFHLQAVVTQGSQIVFTVNGGTFSTAPNSHYPVGPDSSHPCQWIFGIGNYSTFAGTIYAAGATYTP